MQYKLTFLNFFVYKLFNMCNIACTWYTNSYINIISHNCIKVFNIF